MRLSKLSALPFILLLFALFISCDTEDPFSLPPPDFSTVPEPYDTSNVQAVDLSDGVKAYVHEEGYGPFEVTARDQLSIYMTLRTDEGDIIYSSFSSDRTSPITISMGNAGNLQNVFDYSVLMAYTPGFKVGLLGMKVGERRTIVVPPEEGYQDLPDGHLNAEYRDNTLIYDVRISGIGPTKSQ
ncbi:MAG: FKBP-type peptidyl-prolyl cis-trans isomerase [Balneolaceae bacterium]|nr:FKBP-type peptidyl-prolyl cis-trans isomerase [Balneolaceae bacterium]